MPSDSWKLAPGLNNVGSFQVSGRPYCSGSCLAPVSGATSFVLRFPAVTKWFQIEPKQTMKNKEMRVAFSENGLHGKGGANFRMHRSASIRGPIDMKISELWFMSEGNATYTFDVLAGLTNLPVKRLETDDRTIEGTVVASGPTGRVH